MRRFLLGLGFSMIVSLLAISPRVFAKTCLLVAGYNLGYEWHDKQEEAIAAKLKGHCKLEKFYMDTKTNPSPEHSKAMGKKAKELIETLKPDVVITTDDDPVRDVLVPYFKNSNTPFVFCAVKYAMDRFELPFENTTGIIAVVLIKPLVQELLKELKDVKTIISLGDNSEATKNGYKFSTKIWDSFGISQKLVTVKSFEEWKNAFLKAQKEGDGIMLGAFASIKDFDKKQAKIFIEKNVTKVIMATSLVSRPLSMFAMVRYPEEMGEWAGESAIKILNGTKPKEIAITTNKRFDYYINPKLLKKVNITLSEGFMKKAILAKD